MIILFQRENIFAWSIFLYSYTVILLYLRIFSMCVSTENEKNIRNIKLKAKISSFIPFHIILNPLLDTLCMMNKVQMTLLYTWSRSITSVLNQSRYFYFCALFANAFTIFPHIFAKFLDLPPPLLTYEDALPLAAL